MQFEEESPKQYVDIARAPDKEMRPDCPVLPGCGQDGRLLRCPPRPYRHMAFVGRLASGPSWPQRITRLVMKQVLAHQPNWIRVRVFPCVSVAIFKTGSTQPLARYHYSSPLPRHAV